MYVYVPMGSMTAVIVDEYTLTTDGVESSKRIPCLDALLGLMVELKSENNVVKTPVVEPIVQETPVQEAVVAE